MHTCKLLLDISIGRFAGTSTEHYFYTNPVPGGPNCQLNIYEGYTQAPVVLPEASFFNGSVTVTMIASSPSDDEMETMLEYWVN